jgi:hypothetical protein
VLIFECLTVVPESLKQLIVSTQKRAPKLKRSLLSVVLLAVCMSKLLADAILSFHVSLLF